ncbi:MAG TPA: hypothetical protein VHT49_02215 [Acidimicrobiales bacterium]|nr:hypothetical protein [Acidimicrobiales bacterium]
METDAPPDPPVPVVVVAVVVGGVVVVELPDPEVVLDDEGVLELHDARISAPTATATAPTTRIALMWPTFRPIEILGRSPCHT